jgi:glycosyltransferase involved in cell wall biosynthesis
MPSKTIAILGTRGIPARYGGFETFADEIAVRLVRQGVAVTVYCEVDSERESLVDYQGVQLRYVPVPRLGPLTTIIFDLQCLLLARKDFDVVYVLGYGASLFCFIPRLWGKEVWINMDGVEWARSKWSWLARGWLRGMEAVAMWTPNRIIADALAIRAHLLMRHGRLPHCTVIPYGAAIVTNAETSHLDEWGVRPGEYYLVVCRLEPENHVLEILQGFADSDSDYPLLVLGNHQSGTEYVRQLLEVRDPRIMMLGTIFDQTKLQALRFYSRAYFHGHSVGGTNPSLIEAMGCGNVVIAHDNPFNREVAAGSACYFKRAQDIPVLLRELNNNETERIRMGLAAKDRVTDSYTWDAITKAYLELLK